MNVIFISMDTLRADRLSCLGHPRGLTPNLDRIASEGSLFTSAFASDIPTQPSHTAVFTGRVGLSTTVVSHFHPYTVLDDSVSWLPTMFKHRGYATGAVDHLFSMKDWFKRGYKDYMSPPGRSRSPGSVINDIAVPWLENKREEGEDIFLFMHFWDPHIPYVPPSPFKERYSAASAARPDPFLAQRIRSRPTYPLFRRNLYEHLESMPNLEYIADLYDAEVAYLDHEISRLFDHLADLEMLDDTVVVLFGDHGENMTEHDAWFDHAGLYDSVVHVPLIIWGPGRVPQARVESMVQLVDIKPTVLDLLEWDPLEGLDGRSLVPIMKGETDIHREVVYLSECTWQAKRGVRTADWKYIRCIDPGVYLRSEDELYDLRADPQEQRNVAQEQPEVMAEMNALLTAWLEEELHGRPDPMLEVVASGLPAVRRLDALFDEGEVEPHQRVRDEPVTAEVIVPAASSVLTSSLPTAALMAPGGSKAPVSSGLSSETRKLNRRRVTFLAVAAMLAILMLAYAVTTLFSGNVEASGQLQPAEVAELNFVTTNQVTSLAAQPGQAVRSGQVLAKQDASALDSKLAADEAKLAADKTLLANGPTPNETPEQLGSETAQAESSLTAAQTKGANASALDSQAVNNAAVQVVADQTTLANDQQAVTAACTSGTQGSDDTCSSAEHQVAVDQADLSAAQGSVRLAQEQQSTDASNSGSQIAQAQSALSTAQANQAAGTQGQTQTEVSSEQAAVNADEAAVAADQKQVAQAALVAPFAGTVAEVNGAMGDVAGPNGVQQNAPQDGVSTPSSGITLFPSAPVSQVENRQPQQSSFITLESRTMNVIAQVGEGDIEKIHVGQGARVTFPADPSHVYSARVQTIDPESVTQSGKAYFLVHLELIAADKRPMAGPKGLNGLAGLSADVSFN